MGTVRDKWFPFVPLPWLLRSDRSSVRSFHSVHQGLLNDKVNEGRLGNGGRERRDTREELNRGSRTNRNYDGRALAVDDTAEPGTQPMLLVPAFDWYYYADDWFLWIDWSLCYDWLTVLMCLPSVSIRTVGPFPTFTCSFQFTPFHLVHSFRALTHFTCVHFV